MLGMTIVFGAIGILGRMRLFSLLLLLELEEVLLVNKHQLLVVVILDLSLDLLDLHLSQLVKTNLFQIGSVCVFLLLLLSWI